MSYPGHLFCGGGVLPLCKEAVSVFYSPSQLGHRTLNGVGVTSLQRSSWYILQPQLTGPQDARCCCSWGGGVGLPLCREAVGVFYSPSQQGKQRKRSKNEKWFKNEKIRLFKKEERKKNPSGLRKKNTKNKARERCFKKGKENFRKEIKIVVLEWKSKMKIKTKERGRRKVKKR